jgi:hypothetical protein
MHDAGFLDHEYIGQDLTGCFEFFAQMKDPLLGGGDPPQTIALGNGYF